MRSGFILEEELKGFILQIFVSGGHLGVKDGPGEQKTGGEKTERAGAACEAGGRREARERAWGRRGARRGRWQARGGGCGARGGKREQAGPEKGLLQVINMK